MNKREKRRKGVLDFPEKVKRIKEIICEFDEKVNSKPKVQLTGEDSIHEYIKTKYSDEFQLSATWWKTTGKHLVEEYNVISSKTYVIGKGKEIDIPKIMETIERHGGRNKEKLRRELINVDSQITRLGDEIERLRKEAQKLERKLEEKEDLLITETRLKKNYKSLLISLFIYGKDSDNELTKLIQTNKSRSELVNQSLKTAFKDPSFFIKELSRYVSIKEATSSSHEKVIEFPKNVSQVQDDYDY